jgi:hypothetical protein
MNSGFQCGKPGDNGLPVGKRGEKAGPIIIATNAPGKPANPDLLFVRASTCCLLPQAIANFAVGRPIHQLLVITGNRDTSTFNYLIPIVNKGLIESKLDIYGFVGSTGQRCEQRRGSNCRECCAIEIVIAAGVV